MSLSRVQLHKYRILPRSPPLEPGRPRQLRRPKYPLVPSLPTAETSRLRTRSFPTSIRQNQATTTSPSGPLIRATLSQIPAAPIRARTSPLVTTTTANQTSQLPTLRKIPNRVDISKRESTPFRPTGIVEGTDRTSKNHFKHLDPTAINFLDRLSSGTLTSTGL
jgi:hypothetical protein